MKVLFCVVLVAAFAFVGGAAAATAPKSAPVVTATAPKAVCRSTTATRSGPVAHCDAYSLANANTSRLLHLSAKAMPRRSTTPRRIRFSPSVTATPNPFEGTLFPPDLETAYNLPSSTTGSGAEVVGIVDAFDNPSVKSDLDTYDSFFGLSSLPTCATPSSSSCFMKVNQSGAASPLPSADVGWSVEISLDVDTVHTLCQNCKIILVEATSDQLSDLAAAENEAVALGATIITNSYGAAEGGTDGIQQSDFDTYAPDYRHAGVTITASSGDDAFLGGTQFPADVNDVVAVGGTKLLVNSSTAAWTGETAWFAAGSPPSGAGSGCSVFQSPQLWQSGAIGWAATGCNTERAVADVSADADPNSGLWVWSTYAANQQDPTKCQSSPDSNIANDACFYVLGGTSLASPIIAATYALAANPGSVDNESLPYQHYRDLHDVTSGSTGTCGGTTICKAAVGYDGPTGIGTPNGLAGFEIGTPTISSFSPTAGPAGTTITINGQNLSQATAVSVGGTAVQNFTVVSDVKITAVVGAGTTGTIQVTTPGGTATSSGQFQFAPVISSFTPKGGGAGTSVTITGTGFGGATAVAFGGTPAANFTVDSDTQITATTASGTNTGPVTVTGAGGTATSSTPFYGPPSISSVSPGHAGVHGTVTISGANLSGAKHVTVNGANASFTVVSTTKITLTVPSGASASGTIVVTTPGGDGSSGTFTVDPGPAITSFNPGNGAVGQTITITGTNLGGTVAVKIGRILTVPVTVSSTTVTFTIPPGAVTGTITVLSASGSATSSTPLTIG